MLATASSGFGNLQTFRLLLELATRDPGLIPDADLYVPGLIEGAFGSRRWMQQIGKLGGSSRSTVKAEASRENGKRGGRPKEKAAA